MRSYRLNTDKLVNQLIPHFLGGRKLILYLQSCLQPLNSLNQKWKEWADETRLEAAMTSQVIMLENYLNHKFSKYLLDSSQKIVITDGPVNGIPAFIQDIEAHDGTFVLYKADENLGSKSPIAFNYANEKQANSDVSFIVSCPAINPQMITETELTAMISYCVKKYCLAGKKFKVTYNKK